MNESLWEMPVPASAITRGPTFTPLPKRQCELSFYIEVETGDRKCRLLFNGVEAYKCTYLTAINAGMIDAAYGKLVSLGDTQWLTEISRTRSDRYSKMKEIPPELKHLMICFDDGPCYEIVCVSFSELWPE